MTRYAVLRRERDEAVARAVEAERLSNKAELDRDADSHVVECGVQAIDLRAERRPLFGSGRRMSVAAATWQMSEALEELARDVAVDE